MLIHGTYRHKSALGKVRAGDITNRGFSLVEMLLVLLVVGLGTSIAALSMEDDPRKKMQQKARQFSAITRLAVDTSIMSGEPMGLYLDLQSEYDEAVVQWRRLRDGIWINEPMPFQSQVLWSAGQLLLEIDAQVMPWPDQQLQPELFQRPLVVIYPSGEATPFSVTFVDQETGRHIQQVGLDETGMVHWHDGNG